MIIFSSEPVFSPGTVGFDCKDEFGQPYDLLGRKATGERLSELLERITQSLVVALDGGWGSGKSHFLKLWAGAHRLENKGTAQIIYFDAFEHDYLDDPLISLVGAIAKSEPKASGAKAALKSVQKAAMKLARPAARIGFAIATAGGTELAGAVVDEGIKAAGKSAEDAFDDFWQKESGRMAAMDEFRQALTKLTAPKKGEDTPQKLIFIIDELDRCRPDYALTLLEIIKHFFAVPNVHFVLGTNLTALENSVKARYGAGIDATQYLQKFVHLTMNLPTSDQNNITSNARTYLGKVALAAGLGKEAFGALSELIKASEKMAAFSLRDIQRIVSYAQIIPSLERLNANYRLVFLQVTILRVINPAIYRSLRKGTAEAQQVIKALGLDPLQHISEWSSEFWNATLDGKGTSEEYRKMLRDSYVEERRENLERLLTNHLDAFSIALPNQP